jgi:excisionase family DNA binding protein
MNIDRRWITIKETAIYLGIATKSAYDMAARGVLPCARVGRLVRIDFKSLVAGLERQASGLFEESRQGK